MKSFELFYPNYLQFLYSYIIFNGNFLNGVCKFGLLVIIYNLF